MLFRSSGILYTFLLEYHNIITVIGILFGVVFGLTPMANADMQPAVCAGDLMLYYRLDKNLKSDDVVVFQKEGIQYTGRIVAVPGYVVEISYSPSYPFISRHILSPYPVCNLFYCSVTHPSDTRTAYYGNDFSFYFTCINYPKRPAVLCSFPVVAENKILIFFQRQRIFHL